MADSPDSPNSTDPLTAEESAALVEAIFELLEHGKRSAAEALAKLAQDPAQVRAVLNAQPSPPQSESRQPWEGWILESGFIGTKAVIAEFWDWFADWQTDIATAYANGDSLWLDLNLTAWIKRIQPQLNWEMGPYHLPRNTLVISPSTRDNIALAQRVVKAAPTLPNWHFLPAKPAKELKHLVMELSGIASAKIRGDDWVYQLTAFNKMDFFDIEIFTDYSGSLSDLHLELLARRLIESLVGEITYLEKIAAVKVRRADEPRPAKMLTPLPRLGRHLLHLLGEK